MSRLANFARDRVWGLHCFLIAWVNVVQNIDLWIIWLDANPESHLASFDYWQFWNDINCNDYILFEDAKESFKNLYPELKDD